MSNKWGIAPKNPELYIGSHPMERYRKRIAHAVNVREEIWDTVLSGSVVLEREGTLYIRSRDRSMIVPCVHHLEQNSMIVKTVLSKEMNVFYKETKN